MVAISSPSRSGWVSIGRVFFWISFQSAPLSPRESGMRMRYVDGGSPSSTIVSSSSRPTKQATHSLCSTIWRIEGAVSVWYSGTLTWPAIQIAKSAMNHQALFLPSSAMCELGGQPCASRCAARRRLWFMVSAQLKSRTWPSANGWVMQIARGRCRSCSYRHCKGSVDIAGAEPPLSSKAFSSSSRLFVTAVVIVAPDRSRNASKRNLTSRRTMIKHKAWTQCPIKCHAAGGLALRCPDAASCVD